MTAALLFSASRDAILRDERLIRSNFATGSESGLLHRHAHGRGSPGCETRLFLQLIRRP